MNIKQLVPSLEVCQRAQGLGWKRKTAFSYMQVAGEWRISQNLNSSPLGGEDNIPAPTLQEVLGELPLYPDNGRNYMELTVTKTNKSYNVGYDFFDYGQAIRNNMKRLCCWHENIANAALELWCEMEERKVKDALH